MQALRIASRFLCIASLIFADASSALEKRAVRLDEDRLESWNASATCLIRYFNICTGWVWCWSGFEEDHRLGLVVEGCCGGSHDQALLESAVFCCNGSWWAYGYTGTIAVHNVDQNDCPVEPPLASRPYLPEYGNAVMHWNGVPVAEKFVLLVTTSNDYGTYPNTASFATDHPTAGPDGLGACGTCFSPDRPTRSFDYGMNSSPECPGAPFYDGACNAELIWHVLLSCSVAVEEKSWSSIKALYH